MHFGEYADGGNLFEEGGSIYTNGGVFNNDVDIIGNGGTHEDNINTGVQIGVDPEGTPNMVEEGEVIYNDYVYSNRLVATKELLERYKLPKNLEYHSFAEIAERLNKESSERPNDPISKNGLRDSMNKLQQAQEEIKMKQDKTNKGNTNQFAKGGSFDNEAPEDFWAANNIVDPSITKGNLGVSFNKENLFQYAPAIGSGLSVMADSLGLTNRDNTSGLNNIKRVNTQRMATPSINKYMNCTPTERNDYLNQLHNKAAGTRKDM